MNKSTMLIDLTIENTDFLFILYKNMLYNIKKRFPHIIYRMHTCDFRSAYGRDVVLQ